MTTPGECALCGRTPAAGYAMVNDDWYCHGDGDPDPTCYMQAQRIVSYEMRLHEVRPQDPPLDKVPF